MVGTAAMVGTSFVIDGIAIPIFVSIGATYAASTVINASNEEEQKKKYIDGKIKEVKNEFEYICIYIYIYIERCILIIKRMKIFQYG